jgi:L-ascorbate metabolism protein UlaG (beta-lactamase superfamily)
MSMEIRYVGGPTAVVEIGGVRLLTDPTFDPPGEYPIGNRALKKLAGPTSYAPAAARSGSPAYPRSTGPTGASTWSGR